MTSQQIESLIAYLKVLLVKHQEEPTLDNYNAISEQLDKLKNYLYNLIP